MNTRLGADHHRLIMPLIIKDCLKIFLGVHSCKWNKLSEYIRMSNFDSFRKSVKTMLFTQPYGC